MGVVLSSILGAVKKQKLSRDTHQKRKELEKWIMTKSTNLKTALKVTKCLHPLLKEFTTDLKPLLFWLANQQLESTEVDSSFAMRNWVVCILVKWTKVSYILFLEMNNNI